MAEISISDIIKFVDEQKDWKIEGDTSAQEAINIKFLQGVEKIVFDDERVNDTLYFQSRNGNVAIDFDKNGLIINIEVS